MARQVLLKKVEMMKSSTYYGIVTDEYTDVSNKELQSISVRWVAKNFTVYEDFVGYYEIPNMKSDTIVAALKGGLIECSFLCDIYELMEQVTCWVRNLELLLECWLNN